MLSKDEVDVRMEISSSIGSKQKSKLLLITAEGSLLSDEAREWAFEEKEKWSKVAMVIHNLGQTIMAKMSIAKFTPLKILSCLIRRMKRYFGCIKKLKYFKSSGVVILYVTFFTIYQCNILTT